MSAWVQRRIPAPNLGDAMALVRDLDPRVTDVDATARGTAFLEKRMQFQLQIMAIAIAMQQAAQAAQAAHQGPAPG